MFQLRRIRRFFHACHPQLSVISQVKVEEAIMEMLISDLNIPIGE